MPRYLRPTILDSNQVRAAPYPSPSLGSLCSVETDCESPAADHLAGDYVITGCEQRRCPVLLRLRHRGRRPLHRQRPGLFLPARRQVALCSSVGALHVSLCHQAATAGQLQPATTLQRPRLASLRGREGTLPPFPPTLTEPAISHPDHAHNEAADTTDSNAAKSMNDVTNASVGSSNVPCCRGARSFASKRPWCG